MRGEDRVALDRPLTLGGSPPHARGRRTSNTPVGCFARITPACAGKTSMHMSSRIPQ